jgi:hypothetical protein
MKAQTTQELNRLDIPRGGDQSSHHEFLAASLSHWKQKLGFCSMFAALPALLHSNVPVARSNEIKEPERSVAERQRLREKVNKIHSTPALLKLQSKFRLPHQRANFNLLATLTGNDDCPGRTIPGGTYTATAPYVDSGDTTGANDTVTSLPSFYYYYYAYSATGPDHVYSFTLTGRGPNPRIEVSATSVTYKPLIYVLGGNAGGGCPAGTGNHANHENELVMTDSRWFTGSSTATLESWAINSLPLNVPLHLFVDSTINDASGAGTYKVRMQDVTIAAPECPNPFSCREFFVRQHYHDFLNREPDTSGFEFWTNELTQCGGNTQCIEEKSIHVSAAFFLSIEFQQSGYLVYRMYKAAYGDRPNSPVPLTLQEFLPDTQRVGKDVVVGKAGWEQQLATNKNIFANEFSNRSRFTSAFPPGMSHEAFVSALNTNAGGVLTQDERNQLVRDLALGLRTRGEVLWSVAENAEFSRKEFNKAFVLMQYFGYLLRNPNDAPDNNFQGYNFWLDKLNQFNGDFVAAEMVKAFLSSPEFKQRFGVGS